MIWNVLLVLLVTGLAIWAFIYSWQQFIIHCKASQNILWRVLDPGSVDDEWEFGARLLLILMGLTVVIGTFVHWVRG